MQGGRIFVGQKRRTVHAMPRRMSAVELAKLNESFSKLDLSEGFLQL
jgi:hypothetical protein